MIKSMKSFWFWAVVQFCVILSALLAYWYPGAASYIAHPTHVDAHFVYTWSFQIMVFGIFWFLPMLVVFGILVFLERSLIRLILRKRELKEQKSA
jgi:hypothetical protein